MQPKVLAYRRKQRARRSPAPANVKPFVEHKHAPAKREAGQKGEAQCDEQHLQGLYAQTTRARRDRTFSFSVGRRPGLGASMTLSAHRCIML